MPPFRPLTDEAVRLMARDAVAVSLSEESHLFSEGEQVRVRIFR
jgi:hypothetical protein